MLVFLGGFYTLFAQNTFNGDTTPTYHQTVAIYQDLADRYPNAALYTKGPTDCGRPLHLFVVSHPDLPGIQARETAGHGMRVLLINNGIHPGEACGVNASIMLARQLLEGGMAEEMLRGTVVCIIPMYNVGGALQRNSTTRANQRGPLEYGFRGNARNLDLNRDFTKMDSRNAKSFAQLFHEWDPHVYLETHTSNGADYQYTMTMLATQKDKLGGEVGVLLQKTMLPALYKGSKRLGWEIAPYVNVFGRAPEDGGIKGFLDTPRYSSGFAAQFQCMSFVSEAHMLKPFADRVNATYATLLALLQATVLHGEELTKAREADRDALVWAEALPMNWTLDTAASDSISFKGYQAVYEKSQITGQQRLRYDQARPVNMELPIFDRYLPTDGVLKPDYYVVPQAWSEVIERLLLNGVRMLRFAKDTILETESYRIVDFNTMEHSFEGHYLHHGTHVEETRETRAVLKGDYLVPMHSAKDRFVMEALEPVSEDSYFNWNFFDEVLQQKEWFSPYVFEDEAVEMLKENDQLNSQFRSRKEQDPEFASNAWAQLYWLYQHSPHYEQQYLRYPVFRLHGSQRLPVSPLRQ